MTAQNKIYQDFYNEKITLKEASKQLKKLGLCMVAEWLEEVYKGIRD